MHNRQQQRSNNRSDPRERTRASASMIFTGRTDNPGALPISRNQMQFLNRISYYLCGAVLTCILLSVILCSLSNDRLSECTLIPRFLR